jgi:UDP-N-acetylmuramoyl-tripeptide--D-alanyl-D-alanine ligase
MKTEELHQLFLESTGICTDTRKISKGNLFFALKGENFNGNKFTTAALKKGAYRVVIDEIGYHKNTGETILFANSLTLLQKLATYHRTFLKVPIIALTGSNGKTTTKELINAVLKQKYNVVATPGNLNNHIGVPLTLFNMTRETEMGIIEMGANHPGDIELLCKIALPDFGYITNFGKAHIEGFGSVEGVVKAKTELSRHLHNHKKTVFVNGDDPKQ